MMKKILIGLVVVIAIFGIAAAMGGGDTENNNDNSNNNSSQQNKEIKSNLKIGESVKMGNLTHILHNVRFDNGDEFLKPDSGTKWLVADIELKNDGSESEAISTLLMWKLLDSDNRSADVEIGAKTKGSLDAELGAGRSLRGELAFSVSANENKWELIFEPNVFGFGQAIYDIDIKDVN